MGSGARSLRSTLASSGQEPQPGSQCQPASPPVSSAAGFQRKALGSSLTLALPHALTGYVLKSLVVQHGVSSSPVFVVWRVGLSSDVQWTDPLMSPPFWGGVQLDENAERSARRSDRGWVA